MKEIKEISKALKSGEIQLAFDIKRNIVGLDDATNAEIDEVVRQAIITYLKKGQIYQAREAERLFKLPKDAMDETIKQAILSSFRDGDMETVVELKNGLPVASPIARELIAYTTTWGKAKQTDSMREVFA